MNEIPLELPVKASEAAAVADLIFQQAEGRQLSNDLRSRLAGRASVLGLTSLVPYMGSLERDPVHASSYYLAVDGLSGDGRRPLLLRVAPASAPASALFPNPILIGRMRLGGGREILVNAVPFPPGGAAVRTFAEKAAPAALPAARGSQPAITVATRSPAACLPAAFEAFRAVLKTTGVNLASLAAGDALAANDFCDAMLWAAIRAGWREGYAAEAPTLAAHAASTHPALRHAASFTRFPLDASKLLEPRADPRHSEAWPEEEIERRFREMLSPEETASIAALSSPDAARLAVKHAASLRSLETLYGMVRAARTAAGAGRGFDVAPMLGSCDAPALPEDVAFCLHWLKSRGCPAQMVILPLPETNSADDLEARLAALVAALRPFNATPAVRYLGNETEETLAAIGRAAAGRVNYYASRELKAGPPEEEAPAHVKRYIQWIAASLRG